MGITSRTPKGIIYAAIVGTWEPTHSVSLKSPHYDKQGYYESSSIRLIGDLYHPNNLKGAKTELLFIEDLIGLDALHKSPPSSVGEIEMRDGSIMFSFFVSTAFFNRVSLSVSAGKINSFEARGEKIKYNYGSVFEFRLRSL